jgi:serine/threonine protein kinase
LRLFSDILDGLEAAHLKRVFHRDLKPENLLYFSNTNKLLVADFGIAHFEEDQLHTHVETLPAERLANFEYAAPEQRRSGIEVDARSDIFALGLILSELFTGNVPHGLGAIKISEKASTFAYLDGLVDRMLQQDPNRRYSSIREIKNDLVARGNDFIESQKLDQLKKTVVKESETTDPLVVDPPSIVDVQFTSSGLQIKLSQPVTNDWIHTFQNAPLGGLMGYGPERHSFRGDTASIPVPDRLAQQVINQFKGYLDIVNQIYERETKQKAKDAVLREASRLANKIAQEEHTAAIQKSLKW